MRIEGAGYNLRIGGGGKQFGAISRVAESDDCVMNVKKSAVTDLFRANLVIRGGQREHVALSANPNVSCIGRGIKTTITTLTNEA